jgi:hypothetical protein
MGRSRGVHHLPEVPSDQLLRFVAQDGRGARADVAGDPGGLEDVDDVDGGFHERAEAAFLHGPASGVAGVEQAHGPVPHSDRVHGDPRIRIVPGREPDLHPSAVHHQPDQLPHQVAPAALGGPAERRPRPQFRLQQPHGGTGDPLDDEVADRTGLVAHRPERDSTVRRVHTEDGQEAGIRLVVLHHRQPPPRRRHERRWIPAGGLP